MRPSNERTVNAGPSHCVSHLPAKGQAKDPTIAAMEPAGLPQVEATPGGEGGGKPRQETRLSGYLVTYLASSRRPATACEGWAQHSSCSGQCSSSARRGEAGCRDVGKAGRSRRNPRSLRCPRSPRETCDAHERCETRETGSCVLLVVKRLFDFCCLGRCHSSPSLLFSRPLPRVG